MKKLLQICFVLTIVCTNLSVYSQGSFWRVLGNAFTTPVNFIGTTDNQPLSFRTNQLANPATKMIILGDGLGTGGHVGIGLNHNPANDILDLLPDPAFPRTGLGMNNLTVL